MIKFFVFLSFCLGYLVPIVSFAEKAGKAGKSEAPYVKGEILVKLKSEKSLPLVLKEKASWGLMVQRSFKTSGGEIFVLKTSASLKEALSELKKSPHVLVAEPNYIYTIGDVKMQGRPFREEDMSTRGGPVSTDGNLPNDPLFSQLWGLHNVGQPEPTSQLLGVAGADIAAVKAWEIHKGNRRVKIAVIDTGVDYTHPDLLENMWINQAESKGTAGVDDDKNGYIDDIHGYDFANNDSDPMDGHGHGTHCSGTIGAVHDNGLGVAGVMGEVTIVPVKFLADNGSGTTEAAILAIDYATSLNVDIMSNSWGGGGYSQLLKDSIDRAQNKGIIFVAAAGNSSANNDERPNYPSNYETANMVAVSAHTIDDTLATFSSFGQRTVHVAAPGKNVVSTFRGNAYATYSGTSMATPHASGAIGLLLAKEGRQNFASLRDRLVTTSAPIRSLRRKVAAGGRMNAYNLLTNTRPVRNEPDPSAWKRVNLDQAWESDHPYGSNLSLKKVFRIPGAAYVRVVVKKYDLEQRYDFLHIRVPGTRDTVEQVSGIGENYSTEYVEGEQVEVEMTSDYSVNNWGFRIESLEYVLKQ